MVAPVLEQLSRDYAGKVKVVKVNVDDSPRAAAAYQAQSIPTLVFLERGTQVDRVVGAQPKPVLQQHIDELLAARADVSWGSPRPGCRCTCPSRR